VAEPSALTLGPDGSLYIADTNNNRVRRVGPDGIITTVAGTGQCPAFYSNGSDVGEGNPAIQALLCQPSALAMSSDGTLYLGTNERTGGTGAQIGAVRAVLPDGTLVPVTGRGACDVLNNEAQCAGGSAASAGFFSGLEGLSVAPDGSLTIAAPQEAGILTVAPGFPALGLGATYIPSEDGRQIFVFDDTGRQLATLDALTNGTLYTFHYDNQDLLSQIIDGSGDITTIQHDGAGNPTAIIAPGGQRTTLTVDANGYLAGISDPLGNTTQLTATANGLLTSLTTPDGALHQFSYAANGLLTTDQGPDGSSTSLARVDGTDAYTVTVTTALGTATTYVVAQLADGRTQETRLDAGGGRTVITYGLDGSQTAKYPDGSTLAIQQAPDPRWGMMAPVAATVTTTTPGGKTSTITNTRSVVLSTPGDPLSLYALTVTTSLNGAAPTTTTYSAASHTITTVTAAGRSATSTLDGLGRVVSWQPAAGVTPLTYNYDTQGRLVETQEGSQFETYSYDAANNLISTTNAAGQVWQYTYDADGNLTTLTLPGGETYRLGYDADGNQTSLTMPNGAVHTLRYTALDDPAGYIPPGSAPGFGRTYDAEQRLTTSTLPDGRLSTRG
jgi:YD repeat-containing protein